MRMRDQILGTVWHKLLGPAGVLFCGPIFGTFLKLSQRQHNNGMLRAKTKKIVHTRPPIVDPRGFELFGNLPVEIKLAIFDCVPFAQWIVTISRVCKEWRKLCLQSQTPKIFSAEHFTTYGVISANALLSIVKNYQVLGLDLKGLPPKYQESVSYIHILTASKQLSWANMTRLIRETPKNNFKVTSTATSVVFRNSNMINNWINLFPKLTDARLQTGFLSEISLQFATNPTIKIFRCIAKNFEKAHLIIDSIKQRIPNLEELHMYAYERGDVEQTPRLRLETFYKPLEKKAEELGFKLYCRNLFLMVTDLDVFVESFNHQNQPYSYYRSSAPINRTLLSEAVRQSALPVVEFLLENGITSLDKEIGDMPAPPMFYKCPLVRLQKDFPFLVDAKIVKENTTAMLDYLLAKGLNINKKVNGQTFFENEDLSNPTIFYLVSHSNVDWTARSSDGATIIHNIFNSAALEMFRYAAQKIPQEVMEELFKAQDDEGNTPLHLLYNCPEEIFDEISKYQLNWEILNKAGATPLLTLVQTLRYDNLATHFRRMLPLVPSIQKGVVSTIFSKHRSANVLLPEIELLASRGADLNEVVSDVPAVLTLACFSVDLVQELVKHGVNIHVTDKTNRTLLFNVLTPTLVVNRMEVIGLLVHEYKFDINHVTSDGVTPLTLALKNKLSADIIEELLTLGANPNLCGPRLLPSLAHVTPTQYGAAVALGVVETLLKAGADPNQHVYSEDNTAVVVLPLVKLLNAYDSLPMLALLLEHGAKITIKDEIGNTLLHLLQHTCHISHLLPLLYVNAINDLGQTPLWGPLLNNASLKLMLRGANLNHVANDGSTVLHHIVRNSLVPADNLRALLLREIDMSLINKIGQSFAHYAIPMSSMYVDTIGAYSNCTDAMKAKIRAAFNHVDIFGGTVLTYLADSRVDLATVKLVVEAFELDCNPNTNVTLQASWLPEVIEFYLSRGFDPNKKSENGNTLLHSLCGKLDKLETVRALLKYGASITVKNVFGIAPVDIDPNIGKSYYGAVYSDVLAKEATPVAPYAWQRPDDSSSDSDNDDL